MDDSLVQILACAIELPEFHQGKTTASRDDRIWLNVESGFVQRRRVIVVPRQTGLIACLHERSETCFLLSIRESLRLIRERIGA
jgi:hypothetical protein